MKNKTPPVRLRRTLLIAMFTLLGYGSTANAAFFEAVDENPTAEEQIEGLNAELQNSVTTPDGRFTYASTFRGIFIFSRDPDSGNLTQVGLVSGDSFPGGIDIVTVAPESLAISPDSNSLFMSGRFGRLGGVEGDAPIPLTSAVVKFDRDTETGALTFNDSIDLRPQGPGSVSDIALSRDGSRLVVAGSTGIPGTTDLFLINTTNMEPLFTLADGDNEVPGLPASTDMRIALSPDDQTVYLGNPDLNQRNEAVPALAVIAIDPNTNRLDVRQTITESFFEGLDTDIDISGDNAVFDISSIQASDDGEFVYTVGNVRTAEELNNTRITAIGVWGVETDGTLSLARTLSKQELVFDVIGGTGRFGFDPTIALSPDGNHFLYLSESQLFDESSLTAFARDEETGLLSYIDDDLGVAELDRVVHVSATPGGRYLNVAESVERSVTVIDTAVDRTVSVVNNGTTQVQTNGVDGEQALEASLQVFLSNNGPTDDYAVEMLIEQPDDVVLTTDENNCEVLVNGNISCGVLNLFVGDQTSFNLIATTANVSGTSTITASASSNKIDTDTANDVDSVEVALNIVPEDVVDEEVEEAEESNIPIDSDADLLPSASSGGGGCSIYGSRTAGGHDLGLLILLIASAGMLLRRRQKIGLLRT